MIFVGMEHNFDKRDPSIADPLLTPYDFSSMMHYGERAFGIDNKITIRTIDPSKQNLIGQRNGFSDLDIKELQIMYGDICKGSDDLIDIFCILRFRMMSRVRHNRALWMEATHVLFE